MHGKDALFLNIKLTHGSTASLLNLPTQDSMEHSSRSW